jgi:hypothetical protein
MHIPKKYLRDRTILFLVTVNIFLSLLCTVIILLNIGRKGDSLRLTEYRQNLGLSGYHYSTSNTAYLSFIIFALLVATFHILLSIRVYSIRRQFAVAILAMGLLLLTISIIVSNTLLVLR